MINSMPGKKRDKNYNTSHPMYRRWWHMIKRCADPKDPKYKFYGGRGITVCNEWFDFKQYVTDIGIPPTDKHTVDRIDSNIGYNKINIRWATIQEQQKNRRQSIMCLKGHPWTKESTKIKSYGGDPNKKTKICIICEKIRCERYRLKKQKRSELTDGATGKDEV